MKTSKKKLPLSNIRVIELTEQGVGPGAGKLLADFGAESIRIESPQRPDGMRGPIPERQNKSVLFNEFNRNKKGMALNLKESKNQNILHELVSISDLVIENFSPGVMGRLAMDYDTISKINPSIVMVSLSGMGHSGPFGKFAIYGPNLMTWSGLTHLWNHPDIDFPVGSQTYHPDFFAAIFGAYLALGGLFRRMATGHGCYIEAPEGEMGASSLGGFYMQYLKNKQEPQPIGNKSTHMAPHGIYKCKGKDKWVSIAVRNDKDWQGFCKAINQKGWAKEPGLSTASGRLKEQNKLDSKIQSWTKKQSQTEVTEILQSYGVPAGEVMGPKELLEDAHTNHRKFWTKTEHPLMKPIRMEGQPIGLSRTPWQLRLPPFMIGEHTEEILRDLLAVDES